MRSTTREVVIDLDKLEPTVAMPHLPENTKVVSEVAGLPIDQVVIGSCTNGRIQDLREAAAILKGKKVAENVRCIVIPATQEITLQAMKEGLHRDLHRRPAALSPPPPAAPAWVDTWASWRRGSAPSPPPTATLWAAWAM